MCSLHNALGCTTHFFFCFVKQQNFPKFHLFTTRAEHRTHIPFLTVTSIQSSKNLAYFWDISVNEKENNMGLGGVVFININLGGMFLCVVSTGR